MEEQPMLLGDHWKEMVTKWAGGENYHLHTEDDGALYFHFGGADRVVQIKLAPEGRWINLTATDDRYLQEEHIPRAIGAANAWNFRFRRPAAAVVLPDGDAPAWLSWSFDMDGHAEYTEEAFATLIETAISVLLKAFSWLGKEHDL
ncbi:hypothetical protein [Kitasatospora sp. NPDC050543]|uniref:hypothetical protein n=1 Tax=Kitasatospora sp. NPDC050543 TaxID=3364054 RepID=UPI00378BE5F3